MSSADSRSASDSPTTAPQSLIGSRQSSPLVPTQSSNEPSKTSIVLCSACQQPVLAISLRDHQANCDKVKALQAPGQSQDASLKRRLSDVSTASTQSKKARKSSVGAESIKSKAARTSPSSTSLAPKSKVFDINRHCGVINDKNTPCCRSLTCKTHSMGAKRAVRGRRDTFDALLLEWQRATNPNFVERRAVQPRDPNDKTVGKKKRKDGDPMRYRKKQAMTIVGELSGSDHSDGAQQAFDSEEEVELVFEGIQRSRARPLAVPDSSAWASHDRKVQRFRNLISVSFLNHAKQAAQAQAT
ncbi:uncharacterized protein L969DRAFT_87672 [Mixia osmundae IAM 14324]|uniref:SCA7 domain-containing protein n=1 Tax=Mixia osmundae (strain CBS 9802 / IAM 14324 / JCM 22182 / KY 12970) TaxID=764103 RepID=G7E426_MIXOS|nr:uncharacterized protein L969DRAFT_87672 [Mixia osmundae IAM 14324]KEI39679.1 hypothetical protein L969DRAFT_87672 [Mixia osmundae IAM 14324]GAA97586.1 hypothetical protein E5Q_04264 [Mixia osmundae IAM 14324]